jgi:hypothetical protein
MYIYFINLARFYVDMYSKLLRPQQDSSYSAASGIVFWAPFYKGAFLPQELDPKSNIETRSVRAFLLG